MKKYSRIVALIAVIISAIMVSCKKEGGSTEIVSLSKMGTEFYFGQRVPVWTDFNSGARDYTQMHFDWSCSAGRFDDNNTANLFENLWVAPDSIGDFKVTVNAKYGDGGVATRTTDMNVDVYFTDHFYYQFANQLSSVWSQKSNTITYSTSGNDTTNCLTVVPSGTDTPNISRSLSLPLTVPFSVRTRLAFTAGTGTGGLNYRDDGNTDSIPSYTSISIKFQQPKTNTTYPFIREIRWDFAPIKLSKAKTPASVKNYQLRYEKFTPTTGQSVWSSDSLNTIGLPNPLALITPTLGWDNRFQMKGDTYKRFSFAMAADYTFTTYVDGVQWVTSNAIKNWINDAQSRYPGFQAPVPGTYMITYPGLKTTSDKVKTTMKVNEVRITNTPSEIPLL